MDGRTDMVLHACVCEPGAVLVIIRWFRTAEAAAGLTDTIITRG